MAMALEGGEGSAPRPAGTFIHVVNQEIEDNELNVFNSGFFTEDNANSSAQMQAVFSIHRFRTLLLFSQWILQFYSCEV
jgi:hypothetical protein